MKLGRPYFCTVGLVALLALGMAAPRSASDDEEEQVRAAIELFLSQPTTEEGVAAMPAILTFATESDRVTVAIAQDVFVWYSEDDEEEYAGARFLMAAFIAGNVRSQLDTGVAGNDDYSGLLQVIRVYRALVEFNPNLEHEALEQLIEQHAQGELLPWLAERAAEAEDEE